MNLYELNQAGYASLPKMTKAEIETAKEEIIKFLQSHDSDYYMMLNHDDKYFTLFVYENKDLENMSTEMISVAKSLGQIKSIEVNGDIIEFWIQHDKICNMYAVFDYQRGVIKV